MGVYIRDSPFYWLLLERPGQRGIREATKVLVDAPTDAQRKDQRQLAESVYHLRMAELVRGDHGLVKRPTITFRAYTTWYLEHETAHKRSAARERSAIKGLLAWFHLTPLQQIDKAAVIEWRTARSAEVKAATVNRELDTLKDMLATAAPKYLEASPIVGLSRLHAPMPPVRILTPPEVDRLLLTAATAEERALVTVALDTLMRLTDVRTLQRAHDHGTYLDVIDPKVEPYRVPLTPRARRALDALPIRGPYFFPSRHRHGPPRPLSPNTVHRLFVDLCERAGIPQGRKIGGVTFHSLRHTGTTRALDGGANPRAVQAVGGWLSMRQLARYGHATDPAKQRVVDLIGGDPVTPRSRGGRPRRGQARKSARS